jgi:pimeloyl-ACP methyl ester carboxylesterase
MWLYRQILLLVALVAAAPFSAYAFEPHSTGVVVLHGKWGGAGDRITTPLSNALRAAGFAIDQPEMPWSGQRLYDRDYDAAMDEIDAAIARLKAGGAQKIVVAGQSLGANAVLRYAALGKPADAFVLMAPGHVPDASMIRQQTATSVGQARRMVAAGKADDMIAFTDFNTGNRTRLLQIPAAIYLSYFAPDGPAAMSLNAPKLGPVPILWIAGKFDRGTELFEKLVWPYVPAATPTRRVDVNADHLDVPEAGRAAVVQWLRER